MADAKISALTSLASGHATGDLLPIVDVSDTTQAASGTTKQTTLANLLANLPGPTDAVGISYTGQSLTGSNASTLLNLATTWNTSGTPTAVKVNVADVVSTGVMLQAGCREANPIMRNPLLLLGVKAIWLAWWRDAAAQSPEGFSHAGDEKFSAVFWGASIINIRAATNGCRLW